MRRNLHYLGGLREIVNQLRSTLTWHDSRHPFTRRRNPGYCHAHAALKGHLAQQEIGVRRRWEIVQLE